MAETTVKRRAFAFIVFDFQNWDTRLFSAVKTRLWRHPPRAGIPPAVDGEVGTVFPVALMSWIVVLGRRVGNQRILLQTRANMGTARTDLRSAGAQCDAERAVSRVSGQSIGVVIVLVCDLHPPRGVLHFVC